VPVGIMLTEVGVRVSVFRGTTRVAECFERCVVELQPGSYDFWVHPGPHTVGGSRQISVNGPMTIEFDPDTDEHRWGGALLGAVGVGSFVAALFILTSCSRGCATDSTDGKLGNSLLGPLVLTGLIATPVGFSMLGTAMKPEYAIEPEDPERLRAGAPRSTRHVRLRAPPQAMPAQFSVAAMPSKAGGMFGFGVSF
jgi:hypothetical protein